MRTILPLDTKEFSQAMQRDLARLETEQFDLLVIGGGIYGAAIAWDASLRGLRVALVEQRDFCSGTTANSLRIAHGGLRALQQVAVRRLRQSAREQAVLFRIAPSHVQPLPCLVPIYRHSAAGTLAFRAAFTSTRILTADITRSFNVPLPSPRVVSADEALSCFNGFGAPGLVGGALWYDAQVPDIERLVLAFLHSAFELGAAPANYVRARRLVVEGGAVTGIEATDQRTGADFRVRARVTVNAAGPWAGELVDTAAPLVSQIPRQWAQGVNLVIDRPPPPVAIGLRSPWGVEGDPVMGGHRYLFMTGWKGATLAGTSYRFPVGGGQSLSVQVRELIDEWNAASPVLQWSASEVTHQHCGRLPLRDVLQSSRTTGLLERGLVIEHKKAGLNHLISVVGTKFTTARQMAEKTVDSVFHSLGRTPLRCDTADVPLLGDPPAAKDAVSRTLHGIREEMALTLEDVVVRRLGLGLTKCPPVDTLGEIADAAAIEWGWSTRQTDEEIGQLLGRFLPGGATRAA
jgi:glycerol-3-phosphate dehydrogenase